ncbi:zinc finger, C6HC-type containing protein [Tanacetum coccineum]
MGFVRVPCSQGANRVYRRDSFRANRLPRTRSEVKAAANKRLLRPRSQINAGSTRSEVKAAANKKLLRPHSQIKASKQTERYVEPPVETSESTELPEPDYFCDICLETKTESDMFQNKNVCRHLFCSECIGKHVESKIKENMTTVTCPSPRCRREIVPKVCQTIVSKEILNQWTKALYELKKFKCPYKDCLEMLVDNNRKKPGTSSKCPRCKQLYCPHCKVVWHSEMDCKDFQRFRKGEQEPGDLLLMKLAKINSWQRCPKCKFYVDRRDGCPRIDCRCGCVFCHNCGKKYVYYDNRFNRSCLCEYAFN